jgi:zinc transport system substrate-binding protein
MLYSYTTWKAMRHTFFISLILAVIVLPLSQASAGVRVIASIKPVHSLVAAVMGDAGQPALLLKTNVSEHIYSLKPSDAVSLQDADLVFWIGPDLETFLTKPMASLSSPDRAVALINANGIKKLPPRSGPGFADDGDHDMVDPHIWLSPANAKAMVAAIMENLSRIDPANAKVYSENAKRETARLSELDARLRDKLATIPGKGFIVFHDAYQYFEHDFGLHAVGAIAIHPDSPPSAAGLAALRKDITSRSAVCVFAEPQFDPKLISVLTEGTNIKTGTLDPLGAMLQPGPDLYFNVMEALATSLADCLSS